MKKIAFLIPVAVAAAALSNHADANVASTSILNTTKTTKADTLAPTTAIESFYNKNNELHSLMMQPSASGQMLAWHRSHSSHASHSSHYSHRSGY